MSACRAASGTSDPRPHLLALGVLSAPSNTARRRWLRDTQRAFARRLRHSILLKFVFGSRAMKPSSCARLLQEAADDHVFVEAYDNSAVGCVDKAFAWFDAALRAYPAATFIAKADDDSTTHLWSLEALLLQLRHAPLVYAGWMQYASFRPSTFQQCGWSLRADHARSCPEAASASPGRPASRAEGPYPFAAGALEIFSRPLAQQVFASPWTLAFVARARAVARGGRTGPTESWTCAREDATVGYAAHHVASNAGSAVSLVLLNSLMHDISRARPSYAGYLTLHRWAPVDSTLRSLQGSPAPANNRSRTPEVGGQQASRPPPPADERDERARVQLEQASRLRAILDEARDDAAHPKLPVGHLALRCLNRTSAPGRQAAAIFGMRGCANWQVCAFADVHETPAWLQGGYAGS
eukprot:7382989-Prymnesium_polylepis.2